MAESNSSRNRAWPLWIVVATVLVANVIIIFSGHSNASASKNSSVTGSKRQLVWKGWGGGLLRQSSASYQDQSGRELAVRTSVKFGPFEWVHWASKTNAAGQIVSNAAGIQTDAPLGSNRSIANP
jgi:hypothetical protein